MKNKFNQKILIVDDNPKNLQVAMNILKNYNVIYAQSGQKAIEHTEGNDFDLILLDIVMPNMDGYEVCKQLKKNEKTKSIPVIFLTVKDDEKDIVEGFNLGAVDYLTKPFQAEVLLKRVELHLKLSSTINELTLLNNNLNSIVDKQIEDIRQKDEILFNQRKALAISEMIEMMSNQLSKPIEFIKMINQSLEFKLNTDFARDDILESILSTNEQLNYLDMTIEDFKSFFKQDINADSVNLNVMVNSVLLYFKESLIKEKIDVDVDGDINIEVPFVRSELKHILLKLLFNTIFLLKESDIENKELKIFFNENEKNIDLCVESNIENTSDEFIYMTLADEKLDIKNEQTLQLGLHLVKTLIEKNHAIFSVDNRNKKFSYCIEFSKNNF